MKYLKILLILFFSNETRGISQINKSSNSIDSIIIKQSRWFSYYEVSTLSCFLSPPAVPYTLNNGNITAEIMNEGDLLDIGKGYRYNIYEVTDNISIGASATPTVGCGFSEFNVERSSIIPFGLSFSLPVLAEVNYGCVATHRSNKKLGVYVGFGLEWNQSLMLTDVTVYTPNATKIKLYPYNTLWIEPAIKVGFRFSGRQGIKPGELSFKCGFGEVQTFVDGTGNPLTYRAYSYKLSWAWYIHYTR